MNTTMVANAMNTMNTFNQILIRIIKEQELIIGPIAWDEAKKVSGFNVIDSQKGEISFSGEQKETVNNLVARYERLFGRASHEVCRESVQDLIAKMPRDEVPESLK